MAMHDRRRGLNRMVAGLLAVGLAISTCGGCAAVTRAEPALASPRPIAGPGALPPADRIDLELLSRRLLTLTGSALAGRQVGTEGNRAAAEIIAKCFQKAGLSSPPGITDYLQLYAQPVRYERSDPTLSLLGGPGEAPVAFTYLTDFTLQATWSGMRISGAITAPPVVCNDLRHPARSRLAGHVALVPARAFAAAGSDPDDILALGYRYGAVAVILERDYGRGLTYFAKSAAVPPGTAASVDGPLVFCASRAAFAQLRSAANADALVAMSADSVLATAGAANVAGLLPGTDPALADQPLIVSAHFDHLGLTGDGGRFPGAVDNASGTVVVMTVAELMARSGLKPRRPILFIAFNGEEEGLCGARHYAEQPVYPLSATPCVNIDMVGGAGPLHLLADTNEGATGGLQRALMAAAGAVGALSETERRESGYDHVAFAERGGIAVTLSDNDFANYHTSRDDVANVDIARLVTIITIVIEYLTTAACQPSDASSMGTQNVLPPSPRGSTFVTKALVWPTSPAG